MGETTSRVMLDLISLKLRRPAYESLFPYLSRPWCDRWLVSLTLSLISGIISHMTGVVETNN